MKNALKIAASLACNVTQQNPNNENKGLSINEFDSHHKFKFIDTTYLLSFVHFFTL
jgi:hypothetical protein